MEIELSESQVMEHSLRLPMVLVSNLVSKALRINIDYPRRVGCLFSPDGWRNPRGIQYALDNGRFPVWSKGKEWDVSLFENMINKASKQKTPPMWIAVPDVVADKERTLEEWEIRSPKLKTLGWPLAIVVQDGMIPSDVSNLSVKPDVVFVGGTYTWKWRNLYKWTENFSVVHVGRVNTGSGLWRVHRNEAESSDGTGWFHHKQHDQLIRYLSRTQKRQTEMNDVDLWGRRR